MFYIADREWKKVNKDLEETYDISPDTFWMRRLVWLTFALSISTLCAWYFPVIHIVYDIAALITYFYMVIKLTNYYPKKIEEMRNSDIATTTNKTSLPKDAISKNLLMLEPKIKVWIDNEKYCQANITIKDVALEIGTNHNYLSKYLNNCLNVSFQVWLNTLRIEKSKNLLASESISIEEVGVKVGIPLSYNYSRWFKIVTGETPFRYRKSITNCP